MCLHACLESCLAFWGLISADCELRAVQLSLKQLKLLSCRSSVGGLCAGQHVEALEAKPGAQDVYVLLFTTFNCLGRMLGGFGSEWLLHKYACPRSVVL